MSSQINSIFLFRGLWYVIPENIFQFCRGKFLVNFRANLDRVPPCPSTWHKYEKINKKLGSWAYLTPFLKQEDVLREFSVFRMAIKPQMIRIILNVSINHCCNWNQWRIVIQNGKSVSLIYQNHKNAIYIIFILKSEVWKYLYQVQNTSDFCKVLWFDMIQA